ncbi:MAG: formate dehydrogenase accessory sulfurtransferase FdhD [Pseudomonadota bacterium]
MTNDSKDDIPPGERGLRLEGRAIAEPGARPTRINRWEADAGTTSPIDTVAVEEPLEIRLAWTDAQGEAREQSISITMRTPGNDLELAVGFLHGEGIVTDPRQLAKVDHCGPAVGPHQLRNVVKVTLADASQLDLGRLERHFYTTSSCGVCGKTSLEALRVQTRYRCASSAMTLSAAALGALPNELRRHQEVFGRTGGIHASALFDAAGRLGAIREDVGRHNALDKLLGSEFMAGRLPLNDFGVLVSGRASFELMQKAVMAGASMLAAVGAPSSLAVELARDFDVILVGFLRQDRFNVYSGAERLLALEASAGPAPRHPGTPAENQESSP